MNYTLEQLELLRQQSNATYEAALSRHRELEAAVRRAGFNPEELLATLQAHPAEKVDAAAAAFQSLLDRVFRMASMPQAGPANSSRKDALPASREAVVESEPGSRRLRVERLGKRI